VPAAGEDHAARPGDLEPHRPNEAILLAKGDKL